MWGHLMTLVGIIIAFTSPALGAIADQQTNEKNWLVFFVIVNAICAGLLWFAYPQSSSILFTLVICGIGTLTFEYSVLFYNAMLPRLIPKELIGRISGFGWAVGYLGGIVSLSLILVILINPDPPLFGLDVKSAMNVRVIGPIIALWLLLFALPILTLQLPDNKKSQNTYMQSIEKGIHQLYHTFKTVSKSKDLVNFFLGRMFFADGLNTLFAFAGIYAAGTFGFSLSDVIVFGIACNISASIGAFLLSWLDDLLGPKKLMLMNLFCMICFTTMILVSQNVAIFVIFGLSCTFFIGSIQSASRSYLAKVAAPEKRAEMFGFFAFSGKATAFAGPFALAQFTYWFGSQRAGIISIIIFFILGAYLIAKLPDTEEDKSLATCPAA